MFKWRSRRTDQEDKLLSSSHEFRLFVFLFFPSTHTSTSTYSLLYLSLNPKFTNPSTPNFILISCISFSNLISMETTNHLFRSHFFVLSWIILCITVLLASFSFFFFDVCCYSNLLRLFFPLPFEHSSSL